MPYFRSFCRIAKAMLFAVLVLFISLSVHASVVSEEGTCGDYTMTVNGANATVRYCDKNLSTWEDYDEYPAGGGWYWYKSNACAYGRYCKVLCPSGCYCYGNVLDFANYTIVGCNPSSSSPIIRNDTSDESNGFIGVYTCSSAYPYSDRGSSSHQDCYKVVQVGTFVSNTSNGTVSNCTEGYYCPGKSSLTQTQSNRIYNNGSSGRFACPLGTYGIGSGGSSINDCYLCSNGYTTTSVATVGSENGQNICQVCSNSSAGVDTWTTPTKNASSNFVNNKCSIATCKTGYTRTGTGSATATSSYACTANTYTISYVMNGGTNYSGAPTSYTYGVGTTISGTPTHSYASFGGWCTDSGLTNCSNTQTISTTATGNKTFYAKWTCGSGWTGASCGTGATYTISYSMNGGTNYSGAPTSYTYGTGATINGTPTHSHAAFAGWCTDSGLTNCSNSQTISSTATGNKTFYAKWTCSSGWTGASCTTRATYTISYTMNGGTNYSGAPTSYTYGTGATISGTPTRTGYTFGGWCTDSGLSSCSNTQTISTTATGNKTFYAKWTAATVSYVVNHYTSVLGEGWLGVFELYTTETKTGTTGAELTLSDLAKSITGFTYDSGFAYVAGSVPSGTDMPSYGAVTTTTVLADGTRVINLYYYRNWYNVTLSHAYSTYDVYAYSPSGSNTAFEYGDTVTISASTRNGYTWQNWTNTNNGNLLTTSPTYTFIMGDSDVAYTANAVANVYAVTLDNESATTAGTTGFWYQFNTHSPCHYYTNNTSFDSSHCLGSNGYTITPPQKTGYTFGGYWTGQNGTGTKYIFENGTINQDMLDIIADDITLYAYWIANTYTVTLDKNANDATAGTVSVSATYDANMPIPITLPTRSGYTFAGYYDTSAATGGVQYYTVSGASARTWDKAANTTLYARWIANTYTVTLDKNANDATAGTASVTATYDAAMPTPITLPTRSGYVFAGYYDTSAATGGVQYYTVSGASARTWDKAANTTLYARWTSCVAGSYCPGDNGSYFCSIGSYSEAGSSICVPCQNGETTSGIGKTECDTSCQNNTHVLEWIETLWNASTNTVSNLCVIHKCNIGYSLLNNTCVAKNVNLSYIDSMDSSNIDAYPQKCTYDEYFNLPDAPSKEGYRFLKWVLISQ